MVLTATKQTANAFKLKGNLFTLTVMQLLTYKKEQFINQLQETVSQSPKFFQNAPIVIDLNELQTPEKDVDFAFISEQCRVYGLIPIGIRGGSKTLQQMAAKANLAILANTKAEQANEKKKKVKTSANPQYKSTKVITKPIRSGQQIYAKDGDLIVLSSVSAGAEILADGHIHIYGPLRGRALAGVLGDTSARIFCKMIEAELISIAGRYLVSEQLGNYNSKEHVQIYLENNQLKFSTT